MQVGGDDDYLSSQAHQYNYALGFPRWQSSDHCHLHTQAYVDKLGVAAISREDL